MLVGKRRVILGGARWVRVDCLALLVPAAIGPPSVVVEQRSVRVLRCQCARRPKQNRRVDAQVGDQNAITPSSVIRVAGVSGSARCTKTPEVPAASVPAYTNDPLSGDHGVTL